MSSAYERDNARNAVGLTSIRDRGQLFSSSLFNVGTLLQIDTELQTTYIFTCLYSLGFPYSVFPTFSRLAFSIHAFLCIVFLYRIFMFRIFRVPLRKYKLCTLLQLTVRCR